MSWKKIKLGEITHNLDGRRVPLNETERKKKESNKLYPYVGANNILGYIDEFIFNEKILCIAEDGGSWGKNEKCCFIINEKCWVNNHAHVLTAKNGTCLEYLMNYLNYADLNKYITGSTRGKLTKAALNSIEIPLPPLPIQQKIAAILDQADALRKKDRQLLAKYDELLQAVFYDMFGDPVKNEKGWEVKKLGSLTKRIVVGHVGPTSHGYVEKGIPFLRTQNVRENFINYEDMNYISEEFHEKLSKSKINFDDILISRVGVNRGMAAIVPKDLHQANCANVVIVGKSELYNSLFVSFVLNNTFGRGTAFGYSVGSAQGVVNTQIVKVWPIIYPSVELQNIFATTAQNIQQQKEKTSQQIELSENLFQSLLQRAFKGELVKE